MSYCENYQKVLTDVKHQPQIIVVSKQQNLHDILSLYKHGVRDFGENRILELYEKAKALPDDIRWHYVGNIQKNKLSKLLEVNPLIHSISSYEMALLIDQKADEIVKGFLQVNVSKEESKSGVYVDELPDILKKLSNLKFLKIVGLMTMAPFGAEEAELNQLFLKLASFKELVCQTLHLSRCELSMGMSHDYMVAYQCGATYLRIGRAIFS